jgi:hypothetical protein
VILLLLQILTVRAQAERTLEHYANLLEHYRFDDCTSEDIKHWAVILLHITGVDFFPEFYMNYMKMPTGHDHGPLDKLRRQAISSLPRTKFKCGEDGITSNALLVPFESRRILWRLYAGICILSWSVFIACILIVTRHQ